jgi:DNA-binding GntR family transcriptional regulator
VATQDKGGRTEELSAYRETVAQVSTASKVAQVLRERIAEGDFAPGARLSEESISRALGVSRNTLREAFRLLVRDRLVVHEMNRGVFVRVPSARDIKDLFGLRRILEAAAMQAAGGGDLTAVLTAVERGEKAAGEGDWAAVATADLHFHRALTALLDSERVDEVMEASMAELRLAFHAVGAVSTFHRPYLRRNRLILDLLAGGQVEDAVQELESYLRDAERQVVAAAAANGQG